MSDIIVAASIGGAVFALIVVLVILVICLKLRKKKSRKGRQIDLENKIQGTQYLHNSVSKSGQYTSLKSHDLTQNNTSHITESKVSKVGNYDRNVANNFTQNAIVAQDKKPDKENASSFIEKMDSHTVHIHTLSEPSTAMVSDNISMKESNELKDSKNIRNLEDQLKEIPKNTREQEKKVDQNAALNDDEPISFTEESLKVFETSGLTREENKVIEALDDTISGYVNAALDDSNDPFDGEKNADEGVFDLSDKNNSKASSRSSSVSDKSGSDKPGIIVPKRDSSKKREKRPNSVSFQLPENHVDKQTSGQYNTRTMPASSRAQGYKRVLSFYSYRPNNNVWSTQDFTRHYSADDIESKPAIPKGRESISKKSYGPFNATFIEFIKGKPKSEEKLKPVQNRVPGNEPDTRPTLPTHTKQRATILDRDTAKLIPSIEMSGKHQIEDSFKLSNEPYVVKEKVSNSKKDNSPEVDKGDKFLY